ncbi:PREDICTED: uncharacterized protein LOC107073807 [Polistes dominula]|uniref:Uncharacterized protein LOC107073807 n=1 Tax=Polistes dominula TaxID=743375 RepID=A0ABM1JC12_POLDO|nr:PREDICTED: uncharacterized protein LOC107073807 [Polistes dominula]
MLHLMIMRTLPKNITLIHLRALNTCQSLLNQKQTNINANVPGLSEKCYKLPSTPVGPNASKDKEYKNPEYFCYHLDSFAEAEVELAKFRLPAPSNKVPFKQ